MKPDLSPFIPFFHGKMMSLIFAGDEGVIGLQSQMLIEYIK